MNGLYSDDRCSGIEIGEEAYNFCEDIKVLKEQIEQLQTQLSTAKRDYEVMYNLYLGEEAAKAELVEALEDAIEEISPYFGSAILDELVVRLKYKLTKHKG